MTTIRSNSEEKNIVEIFQRSEYIIPDYQRPYSWGEDKCEQLWDDLIDFLRELGESESGGRENYFLGVLTLYENKEKSRDESKSFSVVDGQQRLITLSLLIRALYDVARKNKVLIDCLFQKHPTTGELLKKPRIESKVIEEDKNDFVNIIVENVDELPKLPRRGRPRKNLFEQNYQIFKEKLKNWCEYHKNQGNNNQLGSLISILLHNVKFLHITCDTEEDALVIFETLNDRGTPLDDADILKIRLYDFTKPSEERKEFLASWNNLKGPDRLFRIYMHILRSEEITVPPVMALRKYFLKVNKKSLEKPKKVMPILKKLNHINQDEWQIPSSINKWWKILQVFPNEYWQFPLYTFLIKNTAKEWDQEGMLSIKEGSELAHQFQELIEWTVRYYFIRGVNHNSIDAVRRTTFEAYRSISHDENYKDNYLKSLERNRDFEEFKRNIQEELFPRRYEKGLVLIGAALNKKQNDDDFCHLLVGRFHIEYILPRSGRHYDGWTEDTHTEDVNKLGNLVLCETAIDRKAGNKDFPRKQEGYKQSKIQDLIDLAQKRPNVWTPDDLKARDQAIKERLLNFFCQQAGQKIAS